MAIVISGVNNNDKITASDGLIDLLSGVNLEGTVTAPAFSATGNLTAGHINVGNSIQFGNAGIITATTLIGNVTGNVNHTSDLLLQISGSEKLRIANSGAFGLNGTNYGTSGQVLTSQGSGSSPTWSTISVGGDTGIDFNDNVKIRFGTGNDLEIFHDGTTNRFQSNGLKNFQFNPKDTDVGLKIIGDGACELYHDGTKKLETSSAGITVTGTVDSASDVILKENIKTIDNALDKVTKLRGVEYDYKENKKHSIGVIAQEVEEVLPELVNGSEQKSVAYGNIVAVLIEAIKEQNNQINKMKKEIEELKD